jgi:integrase/recombinase XerD
VTIHRVIDTWLADGKAQGHSPRTHDDRDDMMRRFIWWLENEESMEGGSQADLSILTGETIRRFLVYARAANEKGRFGSDRPAARREAKPSTVNRYFRELRTLMNFAVEESFLDESPLKNVKAPRIPSEQIQPMSAEQIQTLLTAASGMLFPDRNRAVILTLLDSGLRVSELCSLKVGDISSDEIRVRGKGSKVRSVYLGKAARRALTRYVRMHRKDVGADAPLFVAGGGHEPGGPLGASGVRQMIKEAGKRGGLTNVRASPHTLRHSFAVNFLRGGGNLFELQRLMGHADLTTLRRYVFLAEADLARAHRQASPVDHLKLK